MAKKKELAPVEPTTVANLAPAFMDNVEDHGTEALKTYVVPPRMKIVQKMSGVAFEAYSPGTVVAVPAMLELAGPGDPIHVVPIFFYPEWCLWNPIQLKGSLPMIRERTLDPKSPMVALCRDSAKWEIPCPENDAYVCRYTEHLNFMMLVIGNPEFAETVISVSFIRAEHKSGSKFAGLIKMRRAPIYGCQFELRTAKRTNQSGDWFGFDIGQPSEDSEVDPFVQDKQTFDRYAGLYEEMKQAHQESLLRMDYEETEEEETLKTEY